MLAFKEKPDKATADRYVESGRYYWNSGLFVWRADTVLAELGLHLPTAHSGLMEIADAWGAPSQQQTVQNVYPTLPRISIDFAVMEPVSHGRGKAHVVTVEMPVNWLDVGSWPTLAEMLHCDDHDNAMDSDTCVLLKSDNNIIVTRDTGHLLATIGVSDMIIVHTKDVTMICPKRNAQSVKDLVEEIRNKHAGKFL